MAEDPKVDPIPEGYDTLTPYLHVRGAAEAMAFYREALGAEELVRMDGPDGKIMHAEMRIGDSRFMVADENEAWGNRSPASLGGPSCSFVVYLEDVDAAFRRAIDAGAKEVMPVSDHFYGDRSGMVEDPYGHHWNLSTHVEDVPPEEMDRRMKEMMGGG